MDNISGFATSQSLPSNFIEPDQNSSDLSHLFSKTRVQTSISLPASLKGRVSLNIKNPIRLKQWIYQLRGMSKAEYRDLQAIKKEIGLIKRQMRQVAKEMIKEERLLAKLTRKRPGQLLDRKGPRAKLQGKLKQLNESIKQAQAFLQEKEGVTKQLASVHPHLCKGLEKEISTALQAGASYDLFTQLHANCLKIEEATINYAKNPGLTNQQQVSQTYEESLRSMATLLSKLVNNKLQKNDKKMMDFLQKKGIKVGISNIVCWKSFKIEKRWLNALKKSKFGGIVIDDDYVNGVSKSFANDLNLKSNKQMHTMGLKDRTAGFHKTVDNLPPNAKEICKQVEKIINKN
mgnify:CR=1 FL=1